ncbi:MAG: endolytic transglycosylase MltG [Bacteroidota bacterium]
MSKRRLLALAAIAFTLSLLPVYETLWRPNILVGHPARQLFIPHGITFQTLQQTLQQQGYIARSTTFRLAARLLKYDRRVLPGAYQLRPNMSNLTAIRLLRSGAQQPVKVVLNNVRDKTELAAKLTSKLEMLAADFEQLLNDPAFVSQYGFTVENVLTMFVPNTYEVYWTITPAKLFQRMYQEYQHFWNAQRRRQAQKIKLDLQEVSILASIVQAETNKITDAPIIAGVYLNRLRKKMALQSCPTLLYAVGDPAARRVLHKYQNIDSPYNTYKYRGLPPGPINLPSIAMIDAVLNFSAHDYLYFAAKEDFSGYHHFARSFREHLRNAKRYQKALNQIRIYR